MNITISVPDNTPLPFVIAALMPFGAQVIEGEAPALPRVSRSPRPRTVKAHQEYRELIYTKTLADGTTEQREMDGVEVANRIRKLHAQVAAAWRHDGRAPSHFSRLKYQSRDPEETASEYIKRFCSQFNHVQHQYTNGVTA